MILFWNIQREDSPDVDFRTVREDFFFFVVICCNSPRKLKHPKAQLQQAHLGERRSCLRDVWKEVKIPRK